jgi:hypothetical protein
MKGQEQGKVFWMSDWGVHTCQRKPSNPTKPTSTPRHAQSLLSNSFIDIAPPLTSADLHDTIFQLNAFQVS